MTGPTKYTLGFMFSEDREQVLLIRKTKPESIAGMWNGVGGKVEENESFLCAMIREFEEEVGIKTRAYEWEDCIYFTGPDSSCGDFVISIYRMFGDPWQYKKLEAEQPSVWTVADLPPNVVPNVRWMLPMLADRRVIFPLAIEQS